MVKAITIRLIIATITKITAIICFINNILLLEALTSTDSYFKLNNYLLPTCPNSQIIQTMAKTVENRALQRLTEAEAFYRPPEFVPEESLQLSARMPFPRGLDRHTVFTPFDHGPFNWRTNLGKIEEEWLVLAAYAMLDFFDPESAAWGMKAVRTYHPKDQHGQTIPGLTHIEGIFEATTTPPMVFQGPPLFRRHYLDLEKSLDSQVTPTFLRAEQDAYRQTPSKARLADVPVGPFHPVRDPNTIKNPVAPFAEWRIQASAVPYEKYIDGKWVTVLEEPTMAIVKVSVTEIVARAREQLEKEKIDREKKLEIVREEIRRRFVEANKLRSLLSKGRQVAFDREQAGRARLIDEVEARLASYIDAKDKVRQALSSQNQLSLPGRPEVPLGALGNASSVLALTGSGNE